jgi:branched-chain amino acid transport system ATP-binding protein
MSLLSVRNLEVKYGDLIGVADVSFEVEQGGLVALLGSNGAGKTTTLNAIAGLIAPSGGSIRFRGEEIGGSPAYAIVRRGLALSPEGWRLFASQTVEANLRLGATPLRDRSRAAALLDQVYTLFPRLAERRRQEAGTMSGGERQMLAVGRALMSDPALLMLDEPSLGLAPAIVETMYERFCWRSNRWNWRWSSRSRRRCCRWGAAYCPARPRRWRGIGRCSGFTWGWSRGRSEAGRSDGADDVGQTPFDDQRAVGSDHSARSNKVPSGCPIFTTGDLITMYEKYFSIPKLRSSIASITAW